MKRWLQRIGILLVLSVVAVALWTGYVYVNEVPTGFQRLDFDRDISSRIHVDGSKVPVDLTPKVEIDESLSRMDGKRVFLKGYMYPPGVTEGITQFVLISPTKGEESSAVFTLADCIEVQLAAGDTTTFQTRALSVSGTLQIDDRPHVCERMIRIVDAHCEPARLVF